MITHAKDVTVSLFDEYKQLCVLETETTKLRHTTFTAIVSVSMLLPGLALQPAISQSSISLPGIRTLTLSKAVFLLGFLFYLFSLFHYAWHHRYSHRYRKELKSLERRLGIEIYRLRVRPKIGPFKFHYDWALQMIGIVYAAITASYVGVVTFFAAVGVVVGAYLLRLLVSAFEPTEPLET